MVFHMIFLLFFRMTFHMIFHMAFRTFYCCYYCCCYCYCSYCCCYSCYYCCRYYNCRFFPGFFLISAVFLLFPSVSQILFLPAAPVFSLFFCPEPFLYVLLCFRRMLSPFHLPGAFFRSVPAFLIQKFPSVLWLLPVLLKSPVIMIHTFLS